MAKYGYKYMDQQDISIWVNNYLAASGAAVNKQILYS